jgi:hypothetical protein
MSMVDSTCGCRTVSGSERMEALNVDPFERLFMVDRSIRSLPLAVLHQLHFQIES